MLSYVYMRHFIVSLLLVTGLFLVAEPVSAAMTVSVNGIQKNIGLYRTAQSRPAWRRSIRLDQAAKMRAQALLTQARLNHGFRASSASTIARRVGYPARTVGELLAADYMTSRDTVRAWQHSAPHRSILLNRTFQDYGIAVVHTPPGSPFKVIIVVLVARKAGL